MGLPSTIAGILGFIAFIVIIVGMSASDLYPDQSGEIKATQENFMNNINQSMNTTASPGFWNTIFGAVGLDGVLAFIINFFSMIVSFMILSVGYFLLFFGITGTIPQEFYIFFAIIGISLISAVVKLVFFSGD